MTSQNEGTIHSEHLQYLSKQISKFYKCIRSIKRGCQEIDSPFSQCDKIWTCGLRSALRSTSVGSKPRSPGLAIFAPFRSVLNGCPPDIQHPLRPERSALSRWAMHRCLWTGFNIITPMYRKLEVYLILLYAFYLWYTDKATTPRQVQKGGALFMDILSSFMLSIMASVIAYYICKWLDGK